MEQPWTAPTAARAPGPGRWRADDERSDAPPAPREPSAKTPRRRSVGGGPGHADVWRNGWSQLGDETAAFRPARVTAPDSVRYLAGVGVSAIPHPQPHVRLGRPSAPRGSLPLLCFVAGFADLASLAGLFLKRRGRMSPSRPVHDRSLGSSCSSVSQLRPTRLSGTVSLLPGAGARPQSARPQSARLQSAPPHAARPRLPLRRAPEPIRDPSVSLFPCSIGKHTN